jgi:Fur family ferric uptake transcriptional regulator
LKSNDLRKAGLKVTAPRTKILKILEERQLDHLKAEDVYKSLLESGDDIGLATVYRVLTQFEAAGLVKRHNFEGGGAVFELDDGAHHDHLVCQACGRVEEFLDPIIETRQEEIARERGFEILSHSMILYGRCIRNGCAHRKDSS